MNYTTFFMAIVIASNVYAMECDQSSPTAEWIQKHQLNCDKISIIPSRKPLHFVNENESIDSHTFAFSPFDDIACRSTGPHPFYTYYGKAQQNTSISIIPFAEKSRTCINCISFNKDATQLYAGNNAGTLLMWYLSHEGHIFGKGHTALLSMVVLDAHPLNNNQVACGHCNGISFWDTAQATCVRSLPTPYRVSHVKYTPDAKLLITHGDAKESLNFYDTNGHIVSSLQGCGKNNIGGLAVSQDGIYLAVNNGNYKNLLFLFDIRKNSTPVHTWSNSHFFCAEDTLYFAGQSIWQTEKLGITSHNIETFEKHTAELPYSNKPVWNKWNNNLFRFELNKKLSPVAAIVYNFADLIKNAQSKGQDNTAQKKDYISYLALVTCMHIPIHDIFSQDTKDTLVKTLQNNLLNLLSDDNHIKYSREEIVQKMLQNLPEDVHCPICLDIYSNAFTTSSSFLKIGIKTMAGDVLCLLNCKHLLCALCYQNMMDKGLHRCPICRSNFFNL